MPQNSLNRKERLKSRKQIDLLFKKGQRFALPLFRIFYVIKKGELEAGHSRLQFGVGASSKFFKRAVDRNRIKRLGREAWRLQKHPLLLLLEEQNKRLDVFFIYTGKELPAYEEVFATVTEAIQKISARIR